MGVIKARTKIVQHFFKVGTLSCDMEWKYLVLLHKSGNKLDPFNYRGISVTSNLRELFNRIIHSRLLDFIKESSLIIKNQIGFKENSRTSDHLFTITNISEYYRNKRQNVYTAFIKHLTPYGEQDFSTNFYNLIYLQIC